MRRHPRRCPHHGVSSGARRLEVFEYDTWDDIAEELDVDDYPGYDDEKIWVPFMYSDRYGYDVAEGNPVGVFVVYFKDLLETERDVDAYRPYMIEELRRWSTWITDGYYILKITRDGEVEWASDGFGSDIREVFIHWIHQHV